jgi:hypothetical protein
MCDENPRVARKRNDSARNFKPPADRPMNDCIIHIGMHKTGSTSIQHSLQNLQDKKFLYANLGPAANHSLAIFSIFASNPGRHYLHRYAGRDKDQVARYNEDIWRRLKDCIRRAQGRSLVISGEDICALPERDLEKLRNFFDAKFERLTIVSYVRPPVGFLSSAFQQRVQSGRCNTFDPTRMYRPYQKTFGKFDRVFGRERVQLWKFDPSTFPQNDVVSDFCARLQIPLPSALIVRKNDSLSRQAVALLYTYNKFGKLYSGLDGENLSPRLAGLIAHIGRDKFRLAPHVLRAILDDNKDDIAWMEARLGTSLQENSDAARPDDVAGEDDLLRPDRRAIRMLLKTLGRSAPEGVRGRTPEEVALLLHTLASRTRRLWHRMAKYVPWLLPSGQR